MKSRLDARGDSRRNGAEASGILYLDLKVLILARLRTLRVVVTADQAASPAVFVPFELVVCHFRASNVSATRKSRSETIENLADTRLIHFYTLPNVKNRDERRYVTRRTQFNVFPQREGNRRIRSCTTSVPNIFTRDNKFRVA